MTITIEEAKKYINSLQWDGLIDEDKNRYLMISSLILEEKYYLENKETHRTAVAQYALFLSSAEGDPGLTKSFSIGGASTTFETTGGLPMVVASLLANTRTKATVIKSPSWSLKNG